MDILYKKCNVSYDVNAFSSFLLTSVLPWRICDRTTNAMKGRHITDKLRIFFGLVFYNFTQYSYIRLFQNSQLKTILSLEILTSMQPNCNGVINFDLESKVYLRTSIQISCFKLCAVNKQWQILYIVWPLHKTAIFNFSRIYENASEYGDHLTMEMCLFHISPV
jgi:hypothetical protein